MKVKKEATIAVIIGLILALVVTGGVLRARHALQNITLPTMNTDKTKLDRKTAKTNELFLDLTTPDNSVTQTGTMTLTGKTLPGTYIAILGEKAEYLIVPNELGSFSQEITLVKGANAIKISVYQADGKKIERTVSAVYTTAEI